jgi:toxin ParE1/3/4
LARVQFALEVFEDFDRFLEHMRRFRVRDPAARIRKIMQAAQILGHSPLIGRPVVGGERELLISLWSHSYIALYRFDSSADKVFILTIRSQGEDGYKRRP